MTRHRDSHGGRAEDCARELLVPPVHARDGASCALWQPIYGEPRALPAKHAPWRKPPGSSDRMELVADDLLEGLGPAFAALLATPDTTGGYLINPSGKDFQICSGGRMSPTNIEF